ILSVRAASSASELTDRLTMHRIAETLREDHVVKLRPRRSVVIVEALRGAGRLADQRLRPVAAVAVVENPYAGRYVEDLRPMIDARANSAKAWPSLRSRASASTRCKVTARAESSAWPASRSMRMRF